MRLAKRIAAELSAAFDFERAINTRTAYSPVDVMGGFSDYTGATVVSAASESYCVAAAQARDDRQVQVFSFDRFDEHKPFTFVAPLDAIERSSVEQLREHFTDPQTAWAAHAIGAIKLSPELAGRGFSVAIQSNTADPIAHAVAALHAVRTRPGYLSGTTELSLDAARVIREIAGQDAPERSVLACSLASPQRLAAIRSQPNPVFVESVPLPDGVRIRFIDVPAHPDHAKQRARLRVGAEMGRLLILDKMRQLGKAAGRELIADPIGGYLANLDLNDYRRFFRPFLPETFKGGPFLLHHGRLAHKSLHVEPDHHYPVQLATDFHVFGANRTKNFVEALQKAHVADVGSAHELELNKAGHLLYAAHKSLSADAGIDTSASDKLVDWVRANESQGFYGAGLTLSGVAALCSGASMLPKSE